MKICDNCKKKNKDTAKFCSDCGESFESEILVENELSASIDFKEIEENLKLLINSKIDFLVISKDDFYVQFSPPYYDNFGNQLCQNLTMEAVSEDYKNEVKGKSSLFKSIGFKKIPGGNYSKEFPLNFDSIPSLVRLTEKIFTEIFQVDLEGYELDNGGYELIKSSNKNLVQSEKSFNPENINLNQRVDALNHKPFQIPTRIYWILAFAFIIFIGGQMIKFKDDNKPPHTKAIESQFDHFNGSHIKVTQYIKSQMKNPSSFEHVESKYIDQNNYLVIIETYRGTNSFGGIVTSSIKAKVDMDGNIIDIIENISY